jgi:MFS superfamily sulfate permease-like transporter
MASRRGFVLAATLLALLLIAGLVAGVFFASAEATQMGVASSARELARLSAESAMERSVQGWSRTGNGSRNIGETTTSRVEENGMAVDVYVTRLDSSLYWVVADALPARAGSGIGSRIGGVFRVKIGPDGSISVDRISARWWSELF